MMSSSDISIFTVNLESWWTHLPLHQRIDEAARAGFTTAEMWSVGEGDRSAGALKQRARDAGVAIIHCAFDVPDLAVASASKVRETIAVEIDQAEELGARYGTIVGHAVVEGMSKADMLRAYRDRIAEVAPMFEASSVTACIEPFNPFDHPGFFIYGADDAVEMCRTIGSEKVKLNWDLFHMQRHEGNVVHRLREGIDQCGLIQIADSPARREPGTGEMNYPFILGEARKAGFEGPIGLECFPVAGSEAVALDRIRHLAAQLAEQEA